MFVDTAGQHIADAMTMSRSLAEIPSASAILDASNYSFQAITYGKDSAGFKQHAHKILPSQYYDSSSQVVVVSYGNNSFSGYQGSTTANYLSGTYKLYPFTPTPMDTRLEQGSTLPEYTSGVPDVGHYLNSIIDPNLSANFRLIGGFPSKFNTQFKVLKTSYSTLFSGSLPGYYNEWEIMDSQGYLKFVTNDSYVAVASPARTAYEFIVGFQIPGGFAGQSLSAGVFASTYAYTPNIANLLWGLPNGDMGMLILFGGVYHIGVWCLDIKAMLKEGNKPPYNFNTLNNVRKYRLFAKKTFNKDLLSYQGNTTFTDLFVNKGFDNNFGMIFFWDLKF